MFRDYARAATDDQLRLGVMHVWPTGQVAGPRFVINFPTKGHWKAASRLADVEQGLDDLVRVVLREGIRSIAIPPLGCGNGGLDWAVVELLIRAKLEPLQDVQALPYPPAGAPAAGLMPTSEPRPTMTPGRAALIQLLAQYSRHALGDASLIETQKLAYFLQEAGEPLRLDFVGSHDGPYADRLRHVLNAIEGHYLRELGHHPETAQRLARVLELVEGFETPYGLELLATVHWVLAHGDASDDEAVLAAVREWSPRKGRMFTREDITVALDALRSKGWAAALVGAH